MQQDVIYGAGDHRVWVAVLGALTAIVAGTTVFAWSLYGSGLLMHSLQTIAADPFVAYAMFDFVVLLGVLSWWVVRDARRRGIGVWYWIVSFFLLGTIGVMAYLLYARRHAPRADF